MLCATCILMTVRQPFSEGPHHTSLDNLMKAAQAGCKICKSLLLWRQKHGPDDLGEKETEPFITYSWVLIGCPVITFKGPSWLKGDLIMLVQIDPPPLHEIPSWWTGLLKEVKSDFTVEPWRVRPDQFPRRNIPINTGDAKVSRLVLHWLETCRTKHSFCRDVNDTRETDFLPPRLIEISKEKPLMCHLITPRHQKVDVEHKYVALSHCWGKEPSFLTLTATNEAQLRKNISIENLPRNFAEAIEFCQRLGFYYIWIDSLCILQSGSGSEEDWRYHTTIMDAVYANCGLNIAISHASDPSQGCYVNRDAEFLETTFTYPVFPGEVDYLPQDSDIERPMGELYAIVDRRNDGFASLSTEHPLNKRGWVFQERLMSPRTCHFGRDRIFWECHECSCDEYFPEGYSDAISSLLYEYVKPVLPQQILASKPTASFDEKTSSLLRSQWNTLVHNYSQTDLTYPSKDKLAAIAAVAKLFDRFLPDKYVAGLFLSLSPRQPIEQHRTTQVGDCSILQLGWFTPHTTRSMRLESELMELIYDAGPLSNAQSPSWSWASMDCEVRFMDYYRPKALATIDDIEIHAAESRDANGQPLLATVVLTGPTSRIDTAGLKDLVLPEPDSTRNATEKPPRDLDNLTVMWLARGGTVVSLTGGILLAQCGAQHAYRRVGYVELGDRYAREKSFDSDSDCATEEQVVYVGDIMPKGSVVKTVRIV